MVKSSGLSTQPCGDAFAQVNNLIVNRTVSEKVQQEAWDWTSLLNRCCEMVALNAELKSRDRIRTCVFLCSRWLSVRWRAEVTPPKGKPSVVKKNLTKIKLAAAHPCF